VRNKEREQNDDHLRDEGLVPAASDNPDDVDGASGETSRASKTKARGIAESALMAKMMALTTARAVITRT
jgi:hypothetical protein